MSAFRAYDIRGLYPEEIDEELAYKIGRAAVQFLKAKKLLVGRDCRTSSLALKKSFVYGVTDQGCNVIDTGYCNTPMCYFAAQKMNASMITASHNPKQYNGIKITKKGVIGIGEKTGLKKIEKMTQVCHFPTPKTRGRVTAKNILPAYVKEVRKIVNGRYKPLRRISSGSCFPPSRCRRHRQQPAVCRETAATPHRTRRRPRRPCS